MCLVKVRKLKFMKLLLKYFSLDNVFITMALEILELVGSWFISVKCSEIVMQGYNRFLQSS